MYTLLLNVYIVLYNILVMLYSFCCGASCCPPGLNFTDFPLLSLQVFYVSVSCPSSQSPVMLLLYQRAQLSWTVRLMGIPQSTSDG